MTHSAGTGVVVLAAYRPDPELFAAQLRSIRDQTLGTFRCLIGADGDETAVRDRVDQVVGDDPRFDVIGWDDNVGFYLNFERILASVPGGVTWVALSDHDDVWHDHKLERLVPLLSGHSLVSGQARVTADNGDVLLASTNRRVVSPQDLLLQNQVSGALCVFRRELLDVALPFPRLHTVTQLHDHWLAMCAAATGGYVVLDEVLQDYVQHGSNVVGEAPRRGLSPLAALREIRRDALDFEGRSGAIPCLRACRRLSFGWRAMMVDTLMSRVRPPPPWLEACARRADDRTGAGAMMALLRSIRSPDVASSVAATFAAGLPGELAYLWGRAQ